MFLKEWFLYLSGRQKVILFSTILLMILIVAAGYIISPPSREIKKFDYSTQMSIKDLAPKLGVTGKALAKELKLPLDSPKSKSLKNLNITEEQLERYSRHILLKDVGVEGQEKILNSKVMIIGAVLLVGVIIAVVAAKSESSKGGAFKRQVRI